MPSTTRYVGTVAGPYRVLHRERIDGMTLFRVQCRVCGEKHVIQHQTLIKDIKYDIQNCPECVPRGTHGYCGTKLYRRWNTLHCAGVLVAAWHSFETFLAFAQENGHADREGSFGPRNRDLPCGPGNVQFLTHVPSIKRWCTIDGVSYSQSDAADMLGICRERVRQLANAGRLEDRLRDAIVRHELHAPRSEEIPQ